LLIRPTPHEHHVRHRQIGREHQNHPQPITNTILNSSHDSTMQKQMTNRFRAFLTKRTA
jgi:hypothetical protein